MSSLIQYVAPSATLHSIRWLAAIALLSFFALAAIGSSARINGEMNAALQMPGTRTFALVMLAAPLVLAMSRRSSNPSGKL